MKMSKKCKTKHRRKDLDEIDADVVTNKDNSLINQSLDLDVVGGAQHYCVCCARYFVDKRALTEHVASKVHKRRWKALEMEPYTIRESELAAGIGGSYVRPLKRKLDDPNAQSPSTNKGRNNDGDTNMIEVSVKK